MYLYLAFFLWSLALPASGHWSSHPAIVIGRDTVSREAIAFRLARDRCMHDTNATIVRAIAELVSDRLECEVLKTAFHEEPPDSIIRMTAARLPAVTHDSAALACITASVDPAYFLSDYVRPTLVNPRLYDRFHSDSNIHRVARDSIRATFAWLRPHPELFLTYRLDTMTIKRKDTEMVEMPFVRNVLSKLGARKLWPEIVESDNDFSIVMLDTATDSVYRALAIRVPKRPFDTWYHEYVQQNIPIHFLDPESEANFVKTYPRLWWVSKKQ